MQKDILDDIKYIMYLDAKNLNVSAMACVSTARKETNKQIKGRWDC